ncbi:MAG: hypothetical protein Q9169_005270 [Polycauliona sp. 2 TL-2023]
MWSNSGKLVRWASRRSGKQAPFALPLLRTRLYFVQGADNIKALWKCSHTATGNFAQRVFLERMFGMPKEALEVYAADTSGPHLQMYPGSNVPFNDRVDHRTHVALTRLLSGKGLPGFYTRYLTNSIASLENHPSIANDWVQMPDLLRFFQHTFGSALVDALCGPILQTINPQFMDDFIQYDGVISELAMGLPRWCSSGHRIREKLHRSVLQWHAVARSLSRSSPIDRDTDFEPCWGSEYIRTQQQTFQSLKKFDFNAYAASDLGLLWGANTNLIPTSMWGTLHIFRNPDLLRRVRTEIAQVVNGHPVTSVEQLNVEKLMQTPLLQSIYCETLRLNVDVYVLRYPDHEDLRIGEWVFPKESVVLASTRVAHTDETVWNTGSSGEYPLDEFWADRFLVHPSHGRSGPIKGGRPSKATPAPSSECVSDRTAATAASAAPRFSMEGTAGHWFPFGGGDRICPGRHFAKRGFMAACALMVTMFDIEICATDTDLIFDPAYCGLGSQRPAKPVAFKIRRRRSQG